MYATAERTARYVERHPEFRSAAFFRVIFDLKVSSLGIGTYFGAAGEPADRTPMP